MSLDLSMSTRAFTKVEQRELRQLAEAAYEAEAHGYLKSLAAEFAMWSKGEMLSSDLLTSIHHFHEHENRQLWKTYQGLDDAWVVARGLDMGLLKETEITPTLLAKLRQNVGGS